MVLVHGSLDRSISFRRTVRRLQDLRTIVYDRRGYQRSRHGGTTHLAGHIEDLVGIVEASGSGPTVVVGHSFGGTVALGAAVAAPGLIAAVGAWEPPMPWLGFRRRRTWAPPGEPAEEVAAFFERMAGEGTWARLTDSGRASRVADGPALLADMADLRADVAPYDVGALRVPAVFGRGGPASAEHHRAAVEWLATNVPRADLFEVGGAAHGVHLSSPDAFAAFVRRAVARGTGAATAPDVRTSA